MIDKTKQLKLKRLMSDDDIMKVVLDTEMWARVSEDTQSPENFAVVFAPDIHWIGVYIYETIVGVYLIHRTGVYTATVHINILKKYRRLYAQDSVVLIYQYIINHTDYKKLETTIPVIYESVLDFALWAGFKIEGISRASVFKNNAMIDQYMVGITKTEINDWIDMIKGGAQWQQAQHQ